MHQIRDLLAIGFGLEETRPFVECLRAGNESGDVCPASIAVYRRKLAEVEECIDRLSAVRDHLTTQLDKIDVAGSSEEGVTCRARHGGS